jgi:hypothetical protein
LKFFLNLFFEIFVIKKHCDKINSQQHEIWHKNMHTNVFFSSDMSLVCDINKGLAISIFYVSLKNVSKPLTCDT